MGTYVCIENYKTRTDHPDWEDQKWSEFHEALNHTTVEWSNWNTPEMYDNAECSRRPNDIDLFEIQMEPHIKNKEKLKQMCDIFRSDDHWTLYYSY